MTKVDTEKYVEFVDAVTSQPSKDHEAFIYRLQELNGEGFLPSDCLLLLCRNVLQKQVSLLKL
jgi:hypothetical protein